MIHQLKVRQPYFSDIASGRKRFEVRRNDRPFEVGDYLALNEVKVGDTQEELFETGRCILVQVIYMLDEPEYCKEGYVILGFMPCAVLSAAEPWKGYTEDWYAAGQVPVLNER